MQEFSGPVIVTVLYLFFWYYLLLIVQRGTKYRLKEKYESNTKHFDRYFGQDEEMLAADRAVINTLEQMVPFLASLWLHSVFVSSYTATVCGGIYVGLRIFYPLLLGKKVSKIQTKKVYAVTLPCYGLIFYMLLTSLWSVIS